MKHAQSARIDSAVRETVPSIEREAPIRRRKRHHRWRHAGIALLLLVLIAAAVRLALPTVVAHYVNRTLDQSPLYSVRVGDVSLHLWRGAYSIEDVRINKVTANVPVPFFEAKRVDFAVQWDALLHRKLVGRVLMIDPQINFVAAPDEGKSQTGAGGPWLGMVTDLFPFTLNRAVIQNGSIHFRTYYEEQPVDVYISEVEGSIDNLTNIRGEATPLVATIRATGRAMEQAKVELNMILDPFAYRPTFHLTARLLGLDVTELNDLARAHGNLDFERGWFDLVIEAEARQGLLSGYAKPLFRDLKVFSSRDVEEGNLLTAFWQALIGATTSLFQNQQRDQFGTLIPFSGDLSGATRADILATVGNVLRNAFIRAYLPQLSDGADASGFLQFKPAEPDELAVLSESS